jgi:hypothetical protein
MRKRIQKTALRGLIASVATLIALMAALAPSGMAPAAYAGENVCPANPSPPDAGDPDIIVDAPADGATVSSPVTITGQARTFEANVQLRILDEDGTAITETFTTAAEAAPELSPFSADVAFTVDVTQPGCIEVFESSAEDGEPINIVQVPVTLQAAAATPTAAPAQPTATVGAATATPQPVAPPATGTGPGDNGTPLLMLLFAGAGVLLIAVPALAYARRRS